MSRLKSYSCKINVYKGVYFEIGAKNTQNWTFRVLIGLSVNYQKQ